MCQFKTQRFELVEIQIPNGTTLTKFNFPDLPNLTGRNGFPVVIDSIVAYDATTTPYSPISGAAVATAADVAKSFLTIYQGDLQVLYNTPLISLEYVNNGGTNNSPVVMQPLLKDLINVSWTKSYITYANTSAITGNKVFLIGVHYTVHNASY